MTLVESIASFALYLYARHTFVCVISFVSHYMSYTCSLCKNLIRILICDFFLDGLWDWFSFSLNRLISLCSFELILINILVDNGMIVSHSCPVPHPCDCSLAVDLLSPLPSTFPPVSYPSHHRKLVGTVTYALLFLVWHFALFSFLLVISVGIAMVKPVSEKFQTSKLHNFQKVGQSRESWNW